MNMEQEHPKQTDAGKILKTICQSVLWRLEQSEPDLQTLARQMEEAGKLVKVELEEAKPC